MLYSTRIDITTKRRLQEIEGGRKRKQGRTKIAGNRGGGVKRTVPLAPQTPVAGNGRVPGGQR